MFKRIKSGLVYLIGSIVLAGLLLAAAWQYYEAALYICFVSAVGLLAPLVAHQFDPTLWQSNDRRRKLERDALVMGVTALAFGVLLAAIHRGGVWHLAFFVLIVGGLGLAFLALTGHKFGGKGKDSK